MDKELFIFLNLCIIMMSYNPVVLSSNICSIILKLFNNFKVNYPHYFKIVKFLNNVF